jgi:hypothetical protein
MLSCNREGGPTYRDLWCGLGKVLSGTWHIIQQVEMTVKSKKYFGKAKMDLYNSLSAFEIGLSL